MARQLDYEWEKEWVNGKTWVAVAGEDFPEGEEELFLVWLQQMANVEDKWAITRITRMRYSSAKAVIFTLVERDDDIHDYDKDGNR